MLAQGAPRVTAEPGTCTLRLATVRMFGEHEVAAFRADFGRGPVRRWRKRRKGCAIDSATACLCDAGLFQVFREEKARARFTARWERFAPSARPAQRVRMAGQDVVLLHVHDDGCFPLCARGRAVSRRQSFRVHRFHQK